MNVFVINKIISIEIFSTVESSKASNLIKCYSLSTGEVKNYLKITMECFQISLYGSRPKIREISNKSLFWTAAIYIFSTILLHQTKIIQYKGQ